VARELGAIRFSVERPSASAGRYRQIYLGSYAKATIELLTRCVDGYTPCDDLANFASQSRLLVTAIPVFWIQTVLQRYATKT
jgi:hypothetical protein